MLPVPSIHYDRNTLAEAKRNLHMQTNKGTMEALNRRGSAGIRARHQR